MVFSKTNSDKTTILLKNAAEKLHLLSEFTRAEITQPETNWITSLRTSYNQLDRRTEIKKVTRLFSVIDRCLRDVMFLPKDRVINHSDNDFQYTKGAVKYVYWGSKVSMAITCQNGKDEPENLCYIIFQFLGKASVYKVLEISNNYIPTYTSFVQNANLAAIDDDNFAYLHDIVAITISTFFQVVIMKKFRSREFSQHGIDPFFLSLRKKKSTKKRKRKNSSDSDSDNETSAQPSFTNPSYDSLMKLYQSIGEKPNASARLFAVIMEFLKTTYSCSYTSEETWPGGISYDANVHTFLFPKSNENNDINQKKLYLISIVILTDEVDYFVVFRFCDNQPRGCIQKIVKDLIPSFDVDDKPDDLFRFVDINHWLSHINTKFLSAVANDTYHSDHPSCISVNLSEQSSSSSSRADF